MAIKVETEKKYYCLEPERLIKIAEQIGFKLISESSEVDEYFTDIKGSFIKDRTCLRIRKNDDKKIEITYQEKSNSLIGRYCKFENNISVDMNQYDNYVSLFSSLGYYSYVEVIKNRIIYKLDNNKYLYSIRIDNVDMIGGFVEFEVQSLKNNVVKEELKQSLNKLISKFNSLNLKEVMDTYRDIVANYQMKQYDKKTNDIYINLDCEILEYEKKFFKDYKQKISKCCKYNIRWGEYKNNDEISDKIIPLIDEYLDNLIFDNNQLLVTMQLIKQLKSKKHFVTKINQTFLTELFKKIDMDIEDIIYMKYDNYYKVLKSNNIDIKRSIILCGKDIKTINRVLLLILNN